MLLQWHCLLRNLGAVHLHCEGKILFTKQVEKERLGCSAFTLVLQLQMDFCLVFFFFQSAQVSLTCIRANPISVVNSYYFCMSVSRVLSTFHSVVTNEFVF